MILSRTKPAAGPSSSAPQNQQKPRRNNIPSVDEFLAKRDYTGAVTLLEYGLGGAVETVEEKERWIGYCAFHLGDYKRAMNVYEVLSHSKKPPEDISVNLACCYFFLGMYPESLHAAERAPESPLKTRLLFHLAHKLGDEQKLMLHHQELQDIVEDQLSLASIHYLRSHYQEAIDIYKRILLDNSRSQRHFPELTEQLEYQPALMRELSSRGLYLALNVYVALCYYKLDYYDVSQEVLQIYLQNFPDSAIALNLKACNHFRLYNGKAAEAEMKSLKDQSSTSFSFGLDLIKHNLVVFRAGEGALQVLPSLIDVIPEARLNLVIYYLKQDELNEAYHLIKDMEPSVPQEYILKAVVNAAIGQETNNSENLKIAEHYFQMVGSSASECDTIPGRQCMASCYFLNRQFPDVLLYLNSIKSYFHNDDSFNMNYAQAKTAQGLYKEAEELFLLIQNDKYKNDFTYLSNLARCYIMNKKAQSAWELYAKMDQSSDSFSLLQLIANDCYKMGQFWHSARAFDLLDRLDANPEHWEGKRGACCGLFQQIVAGQKANELLVEVIQLLRNTANSQVESIIRVMKRWAKDNRINI